MSDNLSTGYESHVNERGALTLADRNRRFARLMMHHLKHHAITYALVAACFWLIHANYRLLPNATRSIAKSWFVVRLHEPAGRGDFVAFRAPRNGIYPESLWWVKRVVGMEGDVITRNGDVYAINGREVAIAQRHGLTGRVLEPLEVPLGGRLIGASEVFVIGDHPYSFDSRYATVGLVDRSMILGRAYAIY